MPRWIKPVIAVFLVLYLILHLLSLTYREKRALRAPERIVVTLTAPIQRLSRAVVGAVYGVWSGYIALMGTQKENQRLLKENDRLWGEVHRLREVEAENLRLRQHCELAKGSELLFSVAPRVAKGASTFERTIRVQRGSKHGIKRGMAVLHPRGVVGQVLETFGQHSDILLLVDLTSAIDVSISRSRANGILRGASPWELKFEYLSKQADVQVGDEVVTSGLDGIYPKGLPVGVVSFVEEKAKGLFRAARVKPHVDFFRLEEVSIVVGKASPVTAESPPEALP